MNEFISLVHITRKRERRPREASIRRQESLLNFLLANEMIEQFTQIPQFAERIEEFTKQRKRKEAIAEL